MTADYAAMRRDGITNQEDWAAYLASPDAALDGGYCQCGHRLADDAVRCEACGQCVSCGQRLPEGEECGPCAEFAAREKREMVTR